MSEEKATDRAVEACSGCGLRIAGGDDGCRALWDEQLATDFGDARFFRVHRVMVDTYCLQHPARHCASAKSFAAHLTGLCWALEHDGDRAVGNETLRRWLNGRVAIERPEPPAERGALTVANVRAAADPRTHAEIVERWARATWDAYAPLHPVAHRWIEQALAVAPRPRGSR
jgi:hypothetical protein